MNGPKIFIAILILVALVFAVVVFKGVTRKDPGYKPEESPLAKKVQSLLGKRPPLPAADLRNAAPASCVTGSGFLVQTACTVTVGDSKKNLRMAELNLKAGPRVDITYIPRQGQGSQLDLRIDSDHPKLTIPVRDEGGILSLRCIGALQGCRVELNQQTEGA